MSIHAAKEFIIELIDDEEATARADQAYLDALQQIASEKGYDTSAEELRDALRELKGVGEFDEEWFEVTGFAAVFDGRDSFFAAQSAFEPMGFLRY